MGDDPPPDLPRPLADRIAHAARHAHRNHVVAGRQDLLPRQDRGTSDQLREPSADFAVGNLVVSGDGNRVEPLPLRFEDDSSRRQPAVAPRRALCVEIGGDDPVTADCQRWIPLGPIGHRP